MKFVKFVRSFSKLPSHRIDARWITSFPSPHGSYIADISWGVTPVTD